MATSSSVLQEILDGPSLMPPPGVQPNFVNPSNINTACFVILTIALFGTTFAICVRMYTNWFILRSFNWEDYLLLIGTVFYYAYTAVAFKAVLVHAGIHQWNIQVKNIGLLLYWINIEDLVYNCAIPFIKASIILQYLRIFTQVKRISFMYISCWALILCLIIFYTVGFFVIIFACTPRKKYWNPLIQGTCLNTAFLNNAVGVFNVLTDIILVLVPQNEIWKLQMSTRKKATVSIIFLIAFCAVVSSVLRLYYSVKLEQTNDLSYYVARQGIWATCENSIGIICCCLPMFPKFFRVMGPKIVSLYKGSPVETPLKSTTIAAKKSRKHTSGLPGSDSIWKTSSDPQSQVQGPYETLADGHELLQSRTKEGGIGMDEGLSRHELNDSFPLAE